LAGGKEGRHDEKGRLSIFILRGVRPGWKHYTATKEEKEEKKGRGGYTLYLGVIDDAIEPRAACWQSLGDPKEGSADDGSTEAAAAGRLMCCSFVRPSTP
jgi:hypothetical protein